MKTIQSQLKPMQRFVVWLSLIILIVLMAYHHEFTAFSVLVVGLLLFEAVERGLKMIKKNDGRKKKQSFW